jgi:hypothetical protein
MFYYKFCGYESNIVLVADDYIDPETIKKVISENSDKCQAAYDRYLASEDDETYPESNLLEELAVIGLRPLACHALFAVDDWLF